MSRIFPKEHHNSTSSTYRFAEFRLQPTERTLTRAGKTVPIQPKAFDALLVLLLHAGHLVSKAELMRSLWPDVHVVEANLTNMIVSLRKILGRESIRTVSKYGYRFELPILGEPGIDTNTYELFLRARNIIQTRSLKGMLYARDLLSLCVAKSPTYAQGWAWLGRCYLFLDKFSENSPLDREIAQAALESALALQPYLTDAHAFLTLHETDTGQSAKAVVRLVEQLNTRPAQPELYAGLVQALRFQGLLAESMDAHRSARELDPAIPTSFAHTLFLRGDFTGCIDAYAGRTPYYLDAAAWAALGMSERASSILRQRIATLDLSSVLRALLESLLYTITDRRQSALTLMDVAIARSEPEIMIYFARHYSYLGEAERAIVALERAAASGFSSAPEMLRNDPWLASVRQQTKYRTVLDTAVSNVKSLRRRYQRILRKPAPP